MIYRAGVPFVQSRNHNHQASLLFLGDQIRAKKRLELGSSASIEINPQTLEMQVIGVNPNANVFVGFKKVAAKIAKKGGYSKKAASAILASASRKASAKAKRKNPKLRKVKGKAKK